MLHYSRLWRREAANIVHPDQIVEALLEGSLDASGLSDDVIGDTVDCLRFRQQDHETRLDHCIKLIGAIVTANVSPKRINGKQKHGDEFTAIQFLDSVLDDHDANDKVIAKI